MGAIFLILGLVTADADGCARAEKQVRYIAGYDHLVHVENVCEHPIRCTVRTDVNKDGVTQDVPAKGNSTFLTWRGTPKADFTFTVSCEKAAK